MPITELITPVSKQDHTTRELYASSFLPVLCKLVAEAPGHLSTHAGDIVISNDTDISLNFRPFLGLGWNSAQDFQAFVSTPGLQDMKQTVMQLSAERPSPPQLYETDIEPKSVYGSPLTEVFRVKILEDEDKRTHVNEAWGSFVKSIGASTTLSGISVNVPEKTFVGMIGWESEEARKKAYSSGDLEVLKEKVGVLDSLVGALKKM